MLDKKYYINVGPNGTFKPSGEVHTTTNDIDAIFTHLETKKIHRLGLYFHGGLVKERAGLQTAENMVEVFESAESHPVSFVWETGFLEILTQNFTELRETGLFKKILKYAIKQLSKRLGGIGAKGDSSGLTFDEIEAELRAEGNFGDLDEAARGGAAAIHEADLDAIQQEVQAELDAEFESDPEIEPLIRDEAPKTRLLNDNFPKLIESEEAKGIFSWATLAKAIANVVYRVLKRFIKKHDHGFYPTLMEEVLREFYMDDFGAWVWGNMKEVAEEMWAPNDDLNGDDRHPGRYFLEKLQALQTANPNFEVDLVGHSAGSIAICHLLKTVAENNFRIRIRKVAFLAPAATVDLVHREVISHTNRYSQFRSFTMHDDFESKDVLVPGLYTRSLLYLISGILENGDDVPIAGMEHYYSGQEPYDEPMLIQHADFLKATNQDRLVLSRSSVLNPDANEGLRTNAERHGDFDDNAETRESLTHYLKT